MSMALTCIHEYEPVCRYKEFEFVNEMMLLLHPIYTKTHLLTGSLIATRKSWACSAIGEKPSRMICPFSGDIHNGREL